MVQEPASSLEAIHFVPGEPVALRVAGAHVLAGAHHHVMHQVQVVVISDVTGGHGEYRALVRRGGGGGGACCLILR